MDIPLFGHHPLSSPAHSAATAYTKAFGKSIVLVASSSSSPDPRIINAFILSSNVKTTKLTLSGIIGVNHASGKRNVPGVPAQASQSHHHRGNPNPGLNASSTSVSRIKAIKCINLAHNHPCLAVLTVPTARQHLHSHSNQPSKSSPTAKSPALHIYGLHCPPNHFDKRKSSGKGCTPPYDVEIVEKWLSSLCEDKLTIELGFRPVCLATMAHFDLSNKAMMERVFSPMKTTGKSTTFKYSKGSSGKSNEGFPGLEQSSAQCDVAARKASRLLSAASSSSSPSSTSLPSTRGAKADSKGPNVTKSVADRKGSSSSSSSPPPSQAPANGTDNFGMGGNMSNYLSNIYPKEVVVIGSKRRRFHVFEICRRSSTMQPTTRDRSAENGGNGDDDDHDYHHHSASTGSVAGKTATAQPALSSPSSSASKRPSSDGTIVQSQRNSGKRSSSSSLKSEEKNHHGNNNNNNNNRVSRIGHEKSTRMAITTSLSSKNTADSSTAFSPPSSYRHSAEKVGVAHTATPRHESTLAADCALPSGREGRGRFEGDKADDISTERGQGDQKQSRREKLHQHTKSLKPQWQIKEVVPRDPRYPLVELSRLAAEPMCFEAKCFRREGEPRLVRVVAAGCENGSIRMQISTFDHKHSSQQQQQQQQRDNKRKKKNKTGSAGHTQNRTREHELEQEEDKEEEATSTTIMKRVDDADDHDDGDDDDDNSPPLEQEEEEEKDKNEKESRTPPSPAAAAAAAAAVAAEIAKKTKPRLKKTHVSLRSSVESVGLADAPISFIHIFSDTTSQYDHYRQKRRTECHAQMMKFLTPLEELDAATASSSSSSFSSPSSSSNSFPPPHKRHTHSSLPYPHSHTTTANHTDGRLGIHILVGSSLGYAVVFSDVDSVGFKKQHILPSSNEFDSVLCGTSADLDLDGYHELFIGTYSGQLLCYRNSNSIDEKRSASCNSSRDTATQPHGYLGEKTSYKLEFVQRLRHPVQNARTFRVEGFESQPALLSTTSTWALNFLRPKKERVVPNARRLIHLLADIARLKKELMNQS